HHRITPTSPSPVFNYLQCQHRPVTNINPPAYHYQVNHHHPQVVRITALKSDLLMSRPLSPICCRY
ncbi:hypothetical protein BGZ52_006721, partial [Haplosporangium bisporale]